MKTLKGCIGLLLALLLTETSYAATLTLTVGAGEVVKAFDVADLLSPDAFLFLKTTDTAGRDIAFNDYFLPAGRDTYDWQKTNWVTTPISHYASYRTLNSLKSPSCQLTVALNTQNLTLKTQHSKLNTQHYELTVSNPSSEVAFFLRLTRLFDRYGYVYAKHLWPERQIPSRWQF